MNKKVISGLLALTLVAGGAVGLPAVESGLSVGNSITASAASTTTYTYGDYTYTVLYTGTVEITGYTGNGGAVTIPSTLDGKTVTSIGAKVFNGQPLKSVTIPNTVTSIGEFTFAYCSSLTSVTIPNSVKVIGNSAFKGCTGLTGITIPDSVTTIGKEVFYECESLKNITIGSGVTSIGEKAFFGCKSLTSVKFPNSVTTIGYFVFQDCENLTSVTLPNSITSISGGLFLNCTNLTGVTLPSSITKIEDSAFESCTNLKSLTIPSSVTVVGAYAFANCSSLTSMVIPNGETDVRWGIFKDCSSLTSVTIPNTVTSIREYAFSGCSSLKNITIPDSVTEIEISAFEFCPNLTSITIPASVSVIDKRAFGYAGWDGIDEKLDGFKIYGYGDDSAAAKYAKNNGFDYEALHTHNYTSKVTKEATCTKAGEITKTCSCGDVQKETVPATGKHTTVTDKAVAATCVKAGKTEGSHCSVCGTVIKAQKTVAATGKHTYKTTKVVKATTSAKGYTLKTCSVCKATTKTDYTDKLIALSKCKATIPSSSYTYTGKALKPTVTVKSGSTKLKSGTDYTVSYKNNKNTGKATITITGKGKYTGTITKTFNIVPKKATLSSVTSPKTKNIKITWKKDTLATGYEIVYATNSKFTSGKKTVTVTKNSTTSKTISKLTKGKTYYVKVRSYKTINGKKVYGAYSTVKKVKCK